MKISIITVSYNSTNTISHTIESVLNQTYKNVEYIIVDGGSTDGTTDIIQSFGENFLTYISEPDKGIYDALNKGLRMAKGDVIGFLHADDVFAGTDVLQSIAEVFQTYNPDSCYGDLAYVKKGNIEKAIRLWRPGKYKEAKMKSGWMPPHPTFYLKRSLYEKFGGFNLDYKISSDYDLLLRLLGKKKISTFYLPILMVKMRVGGTSNRSLKNIIHKTVEDIKVMKANGFNYLPAIIGKNFSKLNQFFVSPNLLTNNH